MQAKLKTLLVLGAGTDQLFMIKTARSMGLQTVAVDANPNAPGLIAADFAKAIDFSEIEKVIAYCDELKSDGVNLCGISTMGSDIPHIIAAIALHFGWPGPSTQTGLWATHKYLMKQRLQQMNIPIPAFSLIENKADIIDCWQKWQCEAVVIKPTDRAGSRGVRIINDTADISSALTHARAFSLNGEILLEEHIPGLQISTESIIAGKQAYTPGFADRVYEGMECFWPNIMENGGWLPSGLSQVEQKSVSCLVETTARSLGIEYGVAKGDVVICPRRGPMIIEMAARLSGGDFSESLVPLSSGVNYVKTAIEIATNSPIKFESLESTLHKSVANRYFFLPPGKLEAVRGLDWINAQDFCHKVDFYPQIGDQLPTINSHADRAGVFVLTASNKAELSDYIEQAYSKAAFKINGVWHSGRPYTTQSSVSNLTELNSF